MRVVADTNTVVSAFLWGGAPAEMLTAAREQRLTLFTSAALIAELEDVLTREKFAARIAQVGSNIADPLAGYRALTQLIAHHRWVVSAASFHTPRCGPGRYR